MQPVFLSIDSTGSSGSAIVSGLLIFRNRSMQLMCCVSQWMKFVVRCAANCHLNRFHIYNSQMSNGEKKRRWNRLLRSPERMNASGTHTSTTTIVIIVRYIHSSNYYASFDFLYRACIELAYEDVYLEFGETSTAAHTYFTFRFILKTFSEAHAITVLLCVGFCQRRTKKKHEREREREKKIL